VVRILKHYADNTATVCEGYKCDCTNKAVFCIRGETDSFGFERIDLCEDCHSKLVQSIEQEEDEIRRDHDEPAPDGMLWLFTANYQDDSDWCCKIGNNKGKVMVAINRCEDRAARHGGLYDPKLRLVPKTEALINLDRYNQRWNEE